MNSPVLFKKVSNQIFIYILLILLVILITAFIIAVLFFAITRYRVREKYSFKANQTRASKNKRAKRERGRYQDELEGLNQQV